MTASVDVRPATSRRFRLVPVRRRDTRRLREYGPPPGVVLPAHAGDDDPRYPSPRTFRWGLSITIDLILHLACAAVVWVVLSRDHTLSPAVVLLAPLVTFIAVSILHRVFVQRVFHATLGKALTGLHVIRDDTGGPPTLWSLAKAWLGGTIKGILNVLSS